MYSVRKVHGEVKRNAQSAQRKDPLYKNSATPCVFLRVKGSFAFHKTLKNAQSTQRKDPLYKNSVTPCVYLQPIPMDWCI